MLQQDVKSPYRYHKLHKTGEQIQNKSYNHYKNTQDQIYANSKHNF